MGLLSDIPQQLRFADLEVDVGKREIRRQGVLIAVEPKVFDLLHYLLRHRARIVRKNELLDALWPDFEVSEGSLASCVVRLRRALGDADGRFIKTYYGKGYRFVGQCEETNPSDATSASGAAPSSFASPGPPAFVGRETDLEYLQAAFTRARSGHGSLVLISGEQGVGKTRLIERFRDLIAERPSLAIGRCYEGAGAPPFWPWLQILREYASTADARFLRSFLNTNGDNILSLAPELAVGRRAQSPSSLTADAAEARVHLFRSVSAFLRAAAERNPLLLILEDLHWADTPSLLLLRTVAADLANTAILMLATFREDEVQEGHQAHAVLSELVKLPSCKVRPLRGLDSAAATDLIGSLAPDAPPLEFCQRIRCETDGNPFFIEQMMRHLTEAGQLGEGVANAIDWARLGVPEGLQIVVERRLDHLSRGCRHLLAIAAIIGAEFDGNLLNRVRAAELGQSLLQSHDEMQSEIDEAVQARILDAPSIRIDNFRFTHALLRDVVYRAQGIAERTRRHRRAAEALEAEHAAGAYANLSEIAEHYVLGAASGSAHKAVAWAKRAGDAAAAQFAFEPAARRYRQAISMLSLLEESDHVREGALLISLSQAQWGAGEAAAAKETAQQAATVARLHDDAELLAHAALAAGSRIVAQARPDDAFIISLEEAHRKLSGTDSALRVKLLGRLSWAHYYAADGGMQRRALSSEALAMARRLGDPMALVSALSDRHRALMCPDSNEERLAVADELIDCAERFGWRDLLAQGCQQKAWDLAELGEMEAADAAVARLGEVTRDFHNAVKWSYLLWQSMRAMLAGRWDEARHLCQETFEFGRPIDEPFATLTAGTQFLTMQFMLGDVDGLVEQIRSVINTFPNLAATRAALAYTCLIQGRTEEAREEAERCLSRGLQGLPWDTTWLPTVGFLGAVYAELGDRKRCQELYPALLPYANRVGLLGLNASVCYGAVARPLASLALALGQWETADAHFEAAVRINERIGARPWLAYTLFEHARMLQRRGHEADMQRAACLAKEAWQISSELGILPLSNASRSIMQGAQGRTTNRESRHRRGAAAR